MSTTIKPLKFNGNWDLSPALESTDHIQIKEKYDLYIDGKFQSPINRSYFETINPANEKKIAKIAHADEKDVNKAVKAARKAYDGVWGKISAKESCLLYTSPSPRDGLLSRMPSSA